MTKTSLHSLSTLHEIADANRLKANSKLNAKQKAKLGQFMSSSSIARLLADMFENLDGEHRLLDAGAGVGSLTAAFVEKARFNATVIDSTCFEISSVMNNYLADTLKHCSFACDSLGVKWEQKVIKKDFIQHSVESLLTNDNASIYTKAILNPPYLKIAAKGPERTTLRKVNFETGNLYSAFVGLAIKLLENGGELVAITPRSFCNGPYFTEFRKLLLTSCSVNKIHVFNSRTSAFKIDKVLQENVIFHLTKGEIQREMVVVTSSTCAEDASPTTYEVPFTYIVNENNQDRFIHIITNQEEQNIAIRAGGLPCSLEELGIQVSTGKVVDFRTKENLSQQFVKGAIPLILAQHLQKYKIQWPIQNSKTPNALLNNESTKKLMVQNGTYVLTRRRTSKEEKRRIVASIYTSSIADVEAVGFENKTNYFHATGKPLDDNLARGLWVFLNSSLVDKYFRQMNGHTQVNATDLRTLRYPTKEQLLLMEKQMNFKEFDQSKIDNIVEFVLT